MSLGGIHPLAKKRNCPECNTIMFRSQVRYKEISKIEHYQCVNEMCLAKVRIVTKTKTAMQLHTFIVEMEQKQRNDL